MESKGYFKRLPISIRYMLERVGDEDIYGGIKDLLRHPELCAAPTDLDMQWRYSLHVVKYGGLKLVRTTGKLNAYAHLGYFILRKSVNAENKQSFWYLLSLLRNKPPPKMYDLICRYVLNPMVKMGLSDWLHEYISKYPDDIRNKIGAENQVGLMTRAVRTFDPVIIDLIYRAGIDIDPYMYDQFYEYFYAWTCSMYGNSGMNEEFKLIIDPIIERLNAENPERNWEGYNRIMPRRVEIDGNVDEYDE